MATTPFITTDVNASSTPTALTAQDLKSYYLTSLKIAFGDALHDGIITGSQATPSSSTNALQCNLFNLAMPTDGKLTCPGAGPNSGLPILPLFKQSSTIETTIFSDVVKFQRQLGVGGLTSASSNIINGIGITVANPTLDTLRDNMAIKTINNNIYHVRIVKWGGNTKTSPSASGVCGMPLMTKLGLVDGSSILIDVDSVGMLKQLKKGTTNNAKIYYLMLPEYLADSAPKKKWKQCTMCSKAGGINILFAGKLNSNYPAWSPNYRNTFFSRFQCKMSVTDWRNGNMKQEWRDNGSTVVLYNTTNPNNDNNAKNVIQYILSTTGKTSIKIALAYQRKRSGDQFQALAIKRLAASSRFHISSSQGGNELTTATGGAGTPLLPNMNKHSYLVTHDLTLFAYALFLGVNVIFTHIENPSRTRYLYSCRLL